MNETLLKRITELREEKEMSQRQLQKELGLSPSTITKWKTSNPSATTLQAVADYFNVSVEYLLGKTKYRNKEHMLQSFDQNFKPDMTDTEVPHDYCIQTSEGIMLIEGTSPAPRYIDSKTRQIAEKIMNDDRLKIIMEHLADMNQDQFTTIYNMVMMLDHK